MNATSSVWTATVEGILFWGRVRVIVSAKFCWMLLGSTLFWVTQPAPLCSSGRLGAACVHSASRTLYRYIISLISYHYQWFMDLRYRLMTGANCNVNPLPWSFLIVRILSSTIFWMALSEKSDICFLFAQSRISRYDHIDEIWFSFLGETAR